MGLRRPERLPSGPTVRMANRTDDFEAGAHSCCPRSDQQGRCRATLAERRSWAPCVGWPRARLSLLVLVLPVSPSGIEAEPAKTNPACSSVQRLDALAP